MKNILSNFAKYIFNAKSIIRWHHNNTLIHGLNFLWDSWKINFILKIEFILQDLKCLGAKKYCPGYNPRHKPLAILSSRNVMWEKEMEHLYKRFCLVSWIFIAYFGKWMFTTYDNLVKHISISLANFAFLFPTLSI